MLQRPPPAWAQLSVPELWRRIEARIDALAPALRDRIAPPATSNEIDALERSLGHTLPADYVASLREHAGWRAATTASGRPYAEMLVAGFTLLPPAVVVFEREWLTAGYAGPALEHARMEGPLRRAHYDPSWVPVVSHDEDRALYSCLDLAPSEGGSVGQIVSMCTKDVDRGVEWEGLRELLCGHLLAMLEHGELDRETLDDEGILLFEN